MGLFGSTSSFDTDVGKFVFFLFLFTCQINNLIIIKINKKTHTFSFNSEKATNEMNTTEDWTTIMEICDNVANSKQNAKDCLRSIVKRLNAIDPHIVMQAITVITIYLFTIYKLNRQLINFIYYYLQLLDACSNNCGKVFHLEIASRDFEAELKKLLGRTQQKIVDKTRVLLKKWAEGDFKNDPQLNLIPSLYNKLKQDGMDFSTTTTEEIKPSSVAAVAASREEQDLAKAIQLSLKEKEKHNLNNSLAGSTKTMSLYPSVSGHADLERGTVQIEGRKVRALYDFEAAEDNELSFAAGDISEFWNLNNFLGSKSTPSSCFFLLKKVETSDKFYSIFPVKIKLKLVFFFSLYNGRL